jgi:hypothetical protein
MKECDERNLEMSRSKDWIRLITLLVTWMYREFGQKKNSIPKDWEFSETWAIQLLGCELSEKNEKNKY